MEYEKIVRNLRSQAVFMAQNCHGLMYERSGVIRALKEGADAIEELLREKQPASEEKSPVWKNCHTCKHCRTPYNCSPCKDCNRLSVNPGDRDMWEKEDAL